MFYHLRTAPLSPSPPGLVAGEDACILAVTLLLHFEGNSRFKGERKRQLKFKDVDSDRISAAKVISAKNAHDLK